MRAVLSAFDGVLAAEKAKGLDVTSADPHKHLQQLLPGSE